ncbi:MAG: hypothetical protein U0736_12335 [Gemmataceae bacterium]
MDADLAALVEQLEGLRSQTQDVAQRCTGSPIGGSPTSPDSPRSSALQMLRKLESKYRRPIDELIVYRISLDEQEKRLQSAEDDLDGLESELSALFRTLQDTAAELSKQPRQGGEKAGGRWTRRS